MCYIVEILRFIESWVIPLDIASVTMKMAVLVLLMLIGYFCAKIGVTGPESNKYSSKIVLDVLIVGTILNSVINIEPSLTTAQILELFGMSVLMFVIMGAVAWFFPWLLHIKSEDKGLSRIVVLFMNNAFVGFPVIQLVFGTEAVFYASLTNIPFNILMYTVGVAQIRGSEGEKFSWRDIINAPMAATLAAVAVFILRPSVPQVLADTISMLAGATIPLSMIIIGTSLAAIPLKDAFGDWRAYVLSLVRLIICPLAVWAVLRLFNTNGMMLGILTITAACPTAMILTVLCLQYGRDEALASKTMFLSTVMSAVTMPLIIWLLL